jgi:hypothetical protein
MPILLGSLLGQTVKLAQITLFPDSGGEAVVIGLDVLPTILMQRPMAYSGVSVHPPTLHDKSGGEISDKSASLFYVDALTSVW